MRIAVLGSFPLDPEIIPGGVEAVIRNLGVALARMDGHEIHLFSCVPHLPEPRVILYKGMVIHYLRGQARLGNVTGHFLEQRRLLAEVRRFEPDIVHGHGTGSYASAALHSGIPAVITVHGIRSREVNLLKGFRNRIRHWPTIWQENRVLSNARDIFVIADYVGDVIGPMTSATQHPVQNPVDPIFFDSPTTDPGTRVISIAAIQPRKGLLELVEAIHLVRQDIPDVELQLVGKVLDSAYAERLKARIRELQLSESVTLVGFVTENRLLEIFSRCSVFALCSIEESSPVTIAEAMALGKPVVATRVGGIPKLVTPGETGFLVDFGDVGGIATAIRTLLGDSAMRRRFSEKARTFALEHSHPDIAAARTAGVYRTILTRSETQP